jgi:hypothetical protein
MSALEKGRNWGFKGPETVILARITEWLGGKTFPIDGGISIHTDFEPELEKLCANNWDERFPPAHLKLQKAGFVDTRWVGGRRCRWAPTTKFHEPVEHIFGDRETMHAVFVDDDRPGAPLYGDDKELLQHRKAVLATEHLLTEIYPHSWVRLYPMMNPDQSPDGIWYSQSGDVLAYVEAVGDHNNLKSCKNKFLSWAEQEIPVIWVFANRSMMIEMWNKVERETNIGLDRGEFGGDTSNWSPIRVNARLRRTRDGGGPYDSIDCCWTVGGVVRGGADEGEELLEANNIIS